jgi:hypothetical protein
MKKIFIFTIASFMLLQCSITDVSANGRSPADEPLIPGKQSSISEKAFKVIKEEIGIKEGDSTEQIIEKIFIWQKTAFTHEHLGGELIGKRTIEEIIAERTMSGCHDDALLFSGVLRRYDSPALMVDTVELKWVREYRNNKKLMIVRGHVFVEANINKQCILIDSSSGEYTFDYKPTHKFIPFQLEKTGGYYVMFRGLDTDGYGVADNEDLRSKLKTFANNFSEKSISFPSYEIHTIPFNDTNPITDSETQ